MTYILIFIFAFALLGIAHSYIIFPATLRFLAGSPSAPLFYPGFPKDAMPWTGKVSIIMSCYNEEKVLDEKIKSLLGQDYTRGQLNFYIGSDASTDRTNEILQEWERKDPRVKVFVSGERKGKGPMINSLTKMALEEWGQGKDHVLLFTDANVILEGRCISQMVRHFQDKRIGIVDSHMVSVGVREEGISASEKTYIQREVRIKHLEGQLWGYMVGTFGGCYAIRSDAFHPVPENFLVDDFFITLEAIFNGFGAINDLDAKCSEAVSHEISEEYRRKRRISSGNFQNLSYFWPRIRKTSRPLQYCIISHKVLRWFTPLLLILAWLSAGFLWLWGIPYFGFIFIAFLIGISGMILLDGMLEKWNIHWKYFRHLRYFIWMNIAVFEGFIQYLNGIESNVWQPPKRQ